MRLLWPFFQLRQKVAAELEAFDVRRCEQTNDDDQPIVHAYIVEQHGSLDAFNEAVRGGVRSEIVKLLKWNEAIIGAAWVLVTGIAWLPGAYLFFQQQLGACKPLLNAEPLAYLLACLLTYLPTYLLTYVLAYVLTYVLPYSLTSMSSG